MQTQLDRQYKAVQSELEMKVSLQQLNNVEQQMISRINDLVNGLDDRYANKDETRKKLAQLEKAVSYFFVFDFFQLKQLHDMIKQLQATGLEPSNDEAMLTKKYVGPVDCASCDKGVVNLNGMRAEHISWNRLPFREPNERIAKVSSNSQAKVCVQYG